jgi:glycosyltransferase involved in cell wall biosynthesis
MRLGLVIYGNINTLSGGYIYDRILVQYLTGKGHQVDIISIPRRQYGLQLMDNCSRKLYSDLASTRYDVLLQDELNHPSFFLANKSLQKKVAYPIVAIVHQVLCRQPRSNLLNRIYQPIEKRYLQSVNGCIFNSRTTRMTVEQLIEVTPPSIVACPAGDRLGQLSSIDLINARIRQGGPLRLIFVGNVLPNKGLLPLINVLSEVPAEKWFLTVIGSLKMDRSYTRRVERLIADKKVSRQINLTGPKDGGELAKHMSQSHMFIMPYSHEGFGMAYMEAMAFALPVIGSAAGAVKEFVAPGKNGFLIKPDDFNSVQFHINNLYQNRKGLAEMSRAAFRTFMDRPKWEDTMASIQGYLTNLAKSKKEFAG